MKIEKLGALTDKSNTLKYRSWKIKNVTTWDVISNVLEKIEVSTNGYEIVRILPRSVNEKNFITNTTRYIYESLSNWRLNMALIRKETKLLYGSWVQSLWFISIKIWFASIFKECKKWIFALGSFVDNEFLVTIKCIKNALSLNILDNTNILKLTDFYTFYLKKTSVLKNINNYLLIGCNMRLESSTLNLLLRKKSLVDNTIYYSVGSLFNENLNHISLGLSVKNYIKYIQGKNKLCSFFIKNIHVSKKGSLKIKLCENMYIFFGASIQERLDSKFIFKLVNDLAYNVITSIENKFVFSSVYLLSKVAKIQTFIKNWYVLPMNGASALFNAISLVNINGINDISFTDILYICNATKLNQKASFTIYQGHSTNWDLRTVSIILPVKTFFEKKGLYLDNEYKKVNTNIVIESPILCRSNSTILYAVLTTLINFTIFTYNIVQTLNLLKLQKNHFLFDLVNQIKNHFIFEVYSNNVIIGQNSTFYGVKSIINIKVANIYDRNYIYKLSPTLIKMSQILKKKIKVWR